MCRRRGDIRFIVLRPKWRRFNARDPEEIYSHELCSNRTKVDKINIIAVVFKCLADLPDNFAASAPV